MGIKIMQYVIGNMSVLNEVIQEELKEYNVRGRGYREYRYLKDYFFFLSYREY